MPTSIVTNKSNLFLLVQIHSDEIRSFGVRRLGLFGSFVRNQQNKSSDVDLLVDFDPEKKNFDNFMNLTFLLENIFNRRVEVVTTESLSPYLKPHILKEVEYVDLFS